MASQAPTQEGMVALHKAVEDLTALCLQAVSNIEKDANIPGEIHVVESSELGMEVQRLAAIYMMRAWQIEYDGDYIAEAEYILEEFRKFYGNLKAADERFVSKSEKTKLADIEKDFVVFEKMTISNTGRFVPTLAQRTATKLFDQINAVTAAIRQNVEK